MSAIESSEIVRSEVAVINVSASEVQPRAPPAITSFCCALPLTIVGVSIGMERALHL